MELVTGAGVKADPFKGQSSYLDPYRSSYRRFLLCGPIRAGPQESFLSRGLLERRIPLHFISMTDGRWNLVEGPLC